jgi:hypothetical protein
MQVQCTVPGPAHVTKWLAWILLVASTTSIAPTVSAETSVTFLGMTPLLLFPVDRSSDTVDKQLQTSQQASRVLARAEAGSPRDQFLIGQSYAKGIGGSPDLTQARLWYERAANRGEPAAITELGRMYAQGLGVTQDYKTALRWFRRAAGEGYAPAQTDLGLLYFQGLGIVRDEAAAAR